MAVTIEDYDNHIDYLLDIIDSIQKDKCTILTGFNGSGKSLIRNQLTLKIGEGIKVRSVSMQLRTDSNPALGALSMFAHDLPWLATSMCTYDCMEKLFNSHLKGEKQEAYLVIDEPEIGMSYELQIAIGKYLREKIIRVLPYVRGVMVITHSKYVVEALKDMSEFININREKKQVTAEEWLNREIIPVDLNEVVEWSGGLFEAVRDRMNRNKRN